MGAFDYISLSVVFLFCYFVGAIPFGLLITKYAGLGDIRNIGSGNIGATNVLRTGRKFLAFLTLFCDAFKGWLGVYLAGYVFMPQHLMEFRDMHLAVGAVAVILGHIFPIWLSFKGGKGVATTFGAMVALNPLLGLMILIIWLGMAFAFQYSSLAALTAAALTPFIGKFVFDFSTPLFYATCFICALVIAKHKSNIQRLINGAETKINLSKKTAKPNQDPADGTYGGA